MKTKRFTRAKCEKRGDLIAKLYGEGKTVKKLAERFKMSCAGVRVNLHKRNVELRENVRNKGNCQHPERLKRMRRMYAKGMTLREIGKTFSLSGQAVGSFLVRWGVTMRPTGRRKEKTP